MSTATLSRPNGRPPFLDYVRAGLSCVPVRADGSKAASIAWKPFTSRRPTDREAQEWATQYQGVAVICGAVSGNFEAIDIDDPALVQPYLDTVRSMDNDLLAKLCLIQTPRTDEAGNTGIHITYRCECGVPGNTKLAMSEPVPEIGPDGTPAIHPTTRRPITKPRTLIETRGEGGYILTVGCSPECHPSGNQYRHTHGPDLVSLQPITAEERETLHRVARMFDHGIGQAHEEPPPAKHTHTDDGESPGDAFNDRATWEEILEPFGWKKDHSHAGIQHWTRPGKSGGTSATTGVKSADGNELLVNFSTSAHPFEGAGSDGRAGISYSKFAAFTLLNHDGDFSAAAKDLLAQGYGTPRVTINHTDDEYWDSQRESGDAVPTEGERASRSADESTAQDQPQKQFSGIPLSELMKADLEIRFLIDGVLAADQAAVIAGPQKSLKTSIMLDMALALSRAGYFLGRFRVHEAKRVGVMTAEIGYASVRNTLTRISIAAGIDPTTVDNLIITDQVPMIGYLPDQGALRRFCLDHELEFLAVDPLYMCLDSENQSNTSAQGQQLREFSAICQEIGCTVLFAHHTKRETSRIYEPLDLGHLHGAGLPEFVRQWLLISRRTPYVAGSGLHELHMVVGGSVGHEGLWGVNIDEGHRDDPGGRRWEVDVLPYEELQQDSAERKKARKDRAKQEQLETDRKELVGIMAKLSGQVTQREVRDRFSRGYQPFRLAWNSLLDDGTVKSLGKTVKRDNGQKYEGFELNLTEV